MAACILILLFIQSEVSYDTMYGATDRVYRALTIDKALGTNNQRVGLTLPALGPSLPAAFAEVEDALRLTFGGQTLLRYQDRPAIYAEQLRSADANFFDFFDFPLLQGNPKTALAEPYRIAIDPMLLLLATGVALVVSILTVLGQSWRAAAMNPAQALRYE